MKVAVVGAGFCGVAVCWHLMQTPGVSVDLFDEKGIGAGASGAAAGLLHPYVGEAGRKSWKADEGLAATLELIAVAEAELGRPVADRSGVVRIGKVEQLFDDIIPQDDGTYLITSGLTVYPHLYLQGLWQAAAKRGAALHPAKITSLEELAAYDRIVLTVGAGIFAFEEARRLKLHRTKGQALVCALPAGADPLERSIVGKGYLAKGESPRTFYVGSTYEKGDVTAVPCLEAALFELQPKIAGLDPRLANLEVLECRAGIRVGRSGHYIPLLEQLSDKCYAITAMGSRGLLYHAYFAKLLLKNGAIA